jgi:tRNA (mo5U34)-methyltransferase
MRAEARSRPPNPGAGPSDPPRLAEGSVDNHRVARTFNLGSLGVSISVNAPGTVLAPLRRLRRVIRPRNQSEVSASAGHLLLAEKIPHLHLQDRDPARYMDTLRSFDRATNRAGTVSESADVAPTVETTAWYHTIELPNGIVTPGIFDHRKLVPHYGIPADLQGKRVLDVATFDGFWAFEFERRGADVTALDVGRISQCDLPPPMREAYLREGIDRETGVGFRLAHEALKSKVQRVECSVYDLGPDKFGTFDFVHVGDLLLHLENPIAALRSIRSVTAGHALIVDCVDLSLAPGLTRYHGGWSGFVWWLPSLNVLGQMIVDAGFRNVSVRSLYSLGTDGSDNTVWRAAMFAAP